MLSYIALEFDENGVFLLELLLWLTIGAFFHSLIKIKYFARPTFRRLALDEYSVLSASCLVSS
jgi:hypothetical protein